MRQQGVRGPEDVLGGQEIWRALRSLCRTTRNNPVPIGDAGGAGGLARRRERADRCHEPSAGPNCASLQAGRTNYPVPVMTRVLTRARAVVAPRWRIAAALLLATAAAAQQHRPYLQRIDNCAAHPPVADGVAVHVRNADGSPAAQARVFVLHGRGGKPVDLGPTAGDELEAHAREAFNNGDRYAVDAAGDTCVPLLAGDAVLALLGGEPGGFAAQRCAGEVAGLELRLQAARTVELQVTRSDGSPAPGLPLQQELGDRARHLARLDADGRAHFVFVEGSLCQPGMLVTVAVPLRHPLQLLPSLASTSPIVRQLPPCGRVVLTAGEKADLTKATAALATGMDSARRSWQPSERHGNSLVFDCVEPGFDLQAELAVPGITGTFAASLPAVTAGATVSLDLLAAVPWYACQLQDDRGAVLAGVQAVLISTRMGIEDGRQVQIDELMMLKSDADGEVCFVLSPGAAAARRHRLYQSKGYLQPSDRSCGMEFADRTSGRHDLGGVRLVRQ